MNRIQHEFASVTMSAAPVAAEVLERPSELDQQHCIFTPLHYERNYAYPLIVWLHGSQDDERQVTRVMPHISTRNYVAVGPRATVACGGDYDGYRWSQSARHIALAHERVVSAIAAARRWLNICPQRIYLAGLGSGGTMAFRLALAQPQEFAGVLSFGGAFPESQRPLGQLAAARRLRVFLATGRDSEEYPEAAVCEHLRLFHSAGMSVHLRQYPCGDDLLTNMLADMDRWIMDHIASAQGVPASEPSTRCE